MDLGRRTFLKNSALVATAATLRCTPSLARARGRRVAVLGGGVGGMTAAHELAERGFEVTVYEMKDIPGGKARSMPMPGSGRGGRLDLPGEHGFRFFPGFYHHLDDTMSRIPYGNGRNCLGNLVAPERLQFARRGEPEALLPMHMPRSVGDFRDALHFIMGSRLGIPQDDIRFFAGRLLKLLTSCEERRFAEYERIPWWDFIEAGERSPGFRRFMAMGLMRCLVACQPRLVSTRTGGYTFLQLMFSLMGFNGEIDRVLIGPTNDVFIYPWVEHLRRMGVQYLLNSSVKALHFAGGEVRGATLEIEGNTVDIEADWFVLAVPVEVAARLMPDSMKAADPALSRLGNLRVEWMNGIQFFLTEDLHVGIGHTIYFDSPWALTTISQKQYWGAYDLSRFGDGRVRGILSVDVSDWNTPGMLYNKPAKHCTREEVLAEVWAQLKAHLNESRPVLRDDMRIDAHMDPAIRFPAPGLVENEEPLLINTVDSWFDRPEAASTIDNFFLASDYVRTHMDLASMEAACEAARRGVNALLARAGSGAAPCLVTPLIEPAVFAPFKEYDRRRFREGLAHDESVLAQL